MTKVSFAQYTVLRNGHRSLEEAIAEIQREMETRKRILDRWVSEGRIPWMDAHDRFERLMSALRCLLEYDTLLADKQHAQEALTSTPLSSIPEFPLADEPTEQVA